MHRLTGREGQLVAFIELLTRLLRVLVRWLKMARWKRAKTPDRSSCKCWKMLKRTRSGIIHEDGDIFDAHATASQIRPDQWASNLDPDRAPNLARVETGCYGAGD